MSQFCFVLFFAAYSDKDMTRLGSNLSFVSEKSVFREFKREKGGFLIECFFSSFKSVESGDFATSNWSDKRTLGQ